MINRTSKLKWISIIILFIGICFFYSCSGENGDDSIANESGSATVSWVANCEDITEPSVICQVYDSSNTYLTYGGPWDCDDESGKISNIPVGESRKFVLLIEDGIEGVVYRGERANIDVIKENEYNIGNIDLYLFIPYLSAPVNESELSKIPVFEWEYVQGAVKYRILISTNNSLNDNAIDEFMAGPPFYTKVLSQDHSYFWRIYSLDSFGNQSKKSDVWRFSIISPYVDIINPKDQSKFITGQYIFFNGKGSDVDEGELNSDSFVWISSKNGIFAVGNEFETNELSAGKHTITLEVVNNNGISGHFSVDIDILENDDVIIIDE